jgi:hypothetical protein
MEARSWSARNHHAAILADRLADLASAGRPAKTVRWERTAETSHIIADDMLAVGGDA